VVRQFGRAKKRIQKTMTGDARCAGDVLLPAAKVISSVFNVNARKTYVPSEADSQSDKPCLERDGADDLRNAAGIEMGAKRKRYGAPLTEAEWDQFTSGSSVFASQARAIIQRVTAPPTPKHSGRKVSRRRERPATPCKDLAARPIMGLPRMAASRACEGSDTRS
jgi:hypothetical protein